jgi:Polyketide cyclase / dehydrase and lipid transport
MLGIGGAKPVAGQADDVVKCSISKAYGYIGRRFFENYRKWCPQVVELEELSEPPVHLGTKGRQVTRDRGIDSESTFEVSEFSPSSRFEIKGVSEPFRSAYDLISEGNGATRISFTFELQQLDLAMRPFQKLIRAALQDGAIQTIENIKTLLEGARA